MSNGSVFTDIAGKYDRINRILSFGRDQAWRQRVIDLLPEGRLLDLGGGTGAANPVFGNRDVVALDPSPEMLSLNEVASRATKTNEIFIFVSHKKKNCCQKLSASVLTMGTKRFKQKMHHVPSLQVS